MLKNKVPPVVVALIFAVIMACIAHYSVIDLQLFIMVLSVLCAIVGSAFALAGVIAFRYANTTVNPTKIDNASQLVCSGVFKITRNPMYLGFAFMLLGWGIWLSSFYAILAVLGFVLYITVFQILPEEKVLLKLFGDEYKQYMSRVRRWL